MKQVNILSRRRYFFLKFFNSQKEEEFLEEIRQINKPGGFVEILVVEKPASGVYEVHKMDGFEETWEKLAYNYMNKKGEWFFSWKEYDCIYSTKP